MRCEDVRELIGNRLDDELTEEMAHRLDRHLLRCPGCAHELASLQQARQALRAAFGPVMASDSFADRTLSRLYDAHPHLTGRPEPADLSQLLLPLPPDRTNEETP